MKKETLCNWEYCKTQILGKCQEYINFVLNCNEGFKAEMLKSGGVNIGRNTIFPYRHGCFHDKRSPANEAGDVRKNFPGQGVNCYRYFNFLLRVGLLLCRSQ